MKERERRGGASEREGGEEGETLGMEGKRGREEIYGKGQFKECLNL